MMIARLRGHIEQAGFDRAETSGVLVDVNGVGYLVQISARTRSRLPPPAELATLLIDMQVREDAIILYGFLDTPERDWFRNLTTVQGVGGKVALNILSVLGPDELAGAITAQDRASLSRAEGVGPKLAARLVTELKDKARAWGAMPGSSDKTSLRVASFGAPAPTKPAEEAISALVNLGYRPAEASGAVSIALRGRPDAATGDLIRAGLAELGRLKEAAP